MTDTPPPPDFPPPDASMPMDYQSPGGDPKDKLNWAGITALVLGCVNVISWCLPLCGCPVGIAGVVFGIIGLKSNKRGFAMAGLIMSSISILLTLANGIAGYFMQKNGIGPFKAP